MLVYLTAEEIFGTGAGLSISDLSREVGSASVELALGWCAHWIAQLDRPDTDRRDVDREFVDMHFAEPIRSRIQSLLIDPRRVLLTPQTFTVIAKLAIELSPREGPPPPNADVSPLLRAMLGIPAHLTSDVTQLTEDEMVIGVDGGRMALYMVANQLFNNPTDWRTAWAVSHRCLREIPTELNDHPRVVDFEAAYVEATGVPLNDLVTMCAVLWARAMSGEPSLPLSYLEPLQWEQERIEAVLDLISATPETLRELLRNDESELGRWWSTRTFDQFPVVHWGDHLTVLHPSWVVNRSTGAWPLLDVRRAWRSTDDRPRADRISGSVEHAYEHFALEAVEGIVGGEHVYRDDDLRRAFGKRGRVADAAVRLGSSWLVVEVTARGFQLRTAAGSSEDALSRDLDYVVEKARQVEATINNLRANEAALMRASMRATLVDGASDTSHVTSEEVLEVESILPSGSESGPDSDRNAPRRWRFHPVVVIASRFAGNPITFTMLHARLAAAGVLQSDDCAPLEVFELEDLLALEGACENDGCDLLDTLTHKASVSRPLIPMKDYLSQLLDEPASYPDRVDRAWPSWMDTAIHELREEDSSS